MMDGGGVSLVYSPNVLSMPSVESPWRVRAAIRGDLPAILALEREGFARPWTQAMYAEELDRESSWLDLAVSDRGEIVAFVCAWRIFDTCHLLRIATRRSLRNSGIARALVRHLIASARRGSCSLVELEVASRNASALALYRGFGFEVVGRRPGYYKEPVDDAILMNLRLSVAAGDPR
ncbi:MAG TPA: ribosomal-protein-alanine N-acetyltransferase [Nannocystis exedens]|nr:ribosomal-protein-alanine N-acetyltransferase [Nannocystis exedens]